MNKGSEVQKCKSKRAELIQEIHELYKKDKWFLDRRQCTNWINRNGMKPTKENVERWKKESGEFRSEISPKSLASFWLAHIPTDHLFYIISVGKDMRNRNQSFNKWLFWALKVDKENNCVV